MSSSDSYHWEVSLHINLGSEFIKIWTCPELGICKQTNTQRKGWRAESIYYFAGESGPDEPNYTLQEILVEAKYRKAIREQDAIEVDV